MAGGSLTPIIVGVGDVVNRSLKVEDAIEPMKLMLQATYVAINDTTSAPSIQEELRSSIDGVSVVATWTWPYVDLPGLISQNLGVKPTHKVYSKHGGNQPIKLVDEAARRIAQGESKVAIVTGGEALASLNGCATAEKMPPPDWTAPDPSLDASSCLTIARNTTGIGATHSIGLPVHVYPLYENAFRARRGQSIEDNNTESAQLYAEFAKVTENNQFAWNHGQPASTAEDISTVTRRNRMICFPYPLLMNAFNSVNMAASCVLTSTEFAREIGIPESKWIFPLGGAGTQDSDNFWERPDFHSSPSISRSLDACLQGSGLSRDDIDIFDFYSCFPIVPKLACKHLGLPFTNPPKPISLLGGLTSFGGAGNNYSMHALTAMVRELRKGNGRNGLILGNGGVLTYQHAICLSKGPRRDSSAYPEKDPLPPYVTDVPVPMIDTQAEGPAVIETYTVEYNRDGSPATGFIVGRLNSNDHRFVAHAGDSRTLEQLSSRIKEPIGRVGWVKGGKKGSNVFVFGQGPNL